MPFLERDVFWTDREHDIITWEDIKQCPLSLSGGSVRMIMQSSLTNMEYLNVTAITTTKHQLSNGLLLVAPLHSFQWTLRNGKPQKNVTY